MAQTDDLTALSINQFQRLTGKSYRTVAKRLGPLKPVRLEGRAKLYDPTRALPLIYDAADDPMAEKARLDGLRADEVELRLAKERREVVSIHEVAGLWAKLTSEARTRLLALPTKLAPLVIGCRRVPEAKEAIERAIHEALGGLADPRAGVPSGAETAAADDGERVGRRAKAPQSRGKRRAR